MPNATNTVKNKEDGLSPFTGSCQPDLKSKAENAFTAGRDKAEEMVSAVVDHAKDAASSVAHTVGEAGCIVGEKAKEATSAVGGGMKSLAGTIRESTPREGTYKK